MVAVRELVIVNDEASRRGAKGVRVAVRVRRRLIDVREILCDGFLYRVDTAESTDEPGLFRGFALHLDVALPGDVLGRARRPGRAVRPVDVRRQHILDAQQFPWLVVVLVKAAARLRGPVEQPAHVERRRVEVLHADVGRQPPCDGLVRIGFGIRIERYQDTVPRRLRRVGVRGV